MDQATSDIVRRLKEISLELKDPAELPRETLSQVVDRLADCISAFTREVVKASVAMAVANSKAPEAAGRGTAWGQRAALGKSPSAVRTATKVATPSVVSARSASMGGFAADDGATNADAPQAGNPSLGPTDKLNFTRCYSDSSAGRLCSGKGPVGPSLSSEELVSEFANHRLKGNTTCPTALVSVSDRILDTLKRALNKHYEDGEDPGLIKIVFIEIPSDRAEEVAVHSAQRLAEQCQVEKAWLFKHEYLFEWAIPPEYVRHTVSVETLFHRGLDLGDFRCTNIDGVGTRRSSQCILPPVSVLRQAMAAKYIFNGSDSWEVGVCLGSLARPFGARAPLSWIPRRLYLDLVEGAKGDGDEDFFCYYDAEYFKFMDDGIDDVLVEWWLLSDRFVGDEM
ncbi:hypothetical protein L249_2028 [Ophiocordyceps polyrhachis-furcata BCC 54312]|uniref:DUF7587 domain-containing protein n=1 Tax=Ophiocordyceps polyrhachis-furcata BCC 54312 TaxID=1330021 RepID=A0A367LRE4_9HYPO|nr:hypothetical protein L249_2028 [Ophiocordyceps polyrhachis-furcata BCC 54312]